MRSWCLLLLLVVVTVVDSVPSGKAGPKVTFHNRGQLSQTTTRQRITFNSKGQLKLAIFNDLHYGEAEDSFGIKQDIQSAQVMQTVLDAEKPGFVILNGDLITGENTYKENSTHYFDVVVKPLVKGSYQWASTYGNHDSDVNLTRSDLFAREQRYTLSHTQRGPKNLAGITNYILPIYEQTGKKVKAIMYFLDSLGGKNPDGSQQNNWIDANTTQWFKDTHANALKQWGTVPGLLFVHIPTHEYHAIQNKINNTYYPGLNDDVPLAGQGDNPFTYAKQDAAFISVLRSFPDILVSFSGHDHGDAWCGRVKPTDSLTLCFGRHSGYGGYGNWQRGSRIVNLDLADLYNKNGPTVRTHLRMETGVIADSVVLDKTYGRVKYPTSPNDSQ